MEDNELNREIATALLEKIGISVDSVEDGTDAFEELNNLHKEEHFLFLSIRNNVIMCLENKKIKWKEANYEH